MQLYPTLSDPTDCIKLNLPVPHHLPKFAQVHIHCISDAVQLSHPLTPSFPSILSLSQHQRLSNELSVHIRQPKYWSFSFSISPSSEYSGLISLKTDWFDLLAVQGLLGDFSSTTVQRHQILYSHPFNVSPFIQLRSATGWMHIMEK